MERHQHDQWCDFLSSNGCQPQPFASTTQVYGPIGVISQDLCVAGHSMNVRPLAFEVLYLYTQWVAAHVHKFACHPTNVLFREPPTPCMAFDQFHEDRTTVRASAWVS